MFTILVVKGGDRLNELQFRCTSKNCSHVTSTRAGAIDICICIKREEWVQNLFFVSAFASPLMTDF